MLETYQDRIGTASKNGAIRRLLNDAISLTRAVARSAKQARCDR